MLTVPYLAPTTNRVSLPISVYDRLGVLLLELWALVEDEGLEPTLPAECLTYTTYRRRSLSNYTNLPYRYDHSPQQLLQVHRQPMDYQTTTKWHPGWNENGTNLEPPDRSPPSQTGKKPPAPQWHLLLPMNFIHKL